MTKMKAVQYAGTARERSSTRLTSRPRAPARSSSRSLRPALPPDSSHHGAPGGRFPGAPDLGHEGAGVVAELGPGTRGVTVGEAVLVFGPQGCGRCHACAWATRTTENYMDAPGINHDGAMAEYQIVKDTRHLVPLGDLDPVASAS